MSGGSHAERVRAVIESPTSHGLVLRTLRHVSYDVLRYMVPSDVVAYLEHLPFSYNIDPVLEHYASYVFKYPEHCAVWNEELQPFIRSFHLQRRAYTARDLLAVILRAICRCYVNQTQTLAMAQRTTGLPTAAINSSLISKVTVSRVPSGERWESVRKDGTRVFHSRLSRDHSWYLLDPDDEVAIARSRL